MAKGLVRLTWRGAEVLKVTQKNVEDAFTEFGLRVEGYAKKELQKGHGVITGTLRRSIHTAEADYNWSQDDVSPGAGTPELGNGGARAQTNGGRVTLLIGSGLRYAMAVHQGHHGFAGYHYLTNGLAKAKPELKAILEKHRMKR